MHLLGKHHQQYLIGLWLECFAYLKGSYFCTETTLQPLLKSRKRKEYSSFTQLKLILA